MPLTMSDSDLKQFVKDSINRSDNASGSTLSANRQQATDYYLGRVKGERCTEDGLSDQISGDVADMTDAIMAEMAMNALAGEQIAEFPPQGDEDRIGALVETLAVNKVIFDQNRGYELLSNAGQSACLYKLGAIHVEAEQIEIDRTRYIGPVAGEGKRVLEGETDGEIDADGFLNWTEVRKRAVCRNVEQENFFYEGEYPGWSLDHSGFTAERRYYTRGDLTGLGYPWDKVKDLTRSAVVREDEEGHRYADQGNATRQTGADEQDIIETYWCYVRLPMSDHSLKLHKVHLCGGTSTGEILSKEPADMNGFAVGRIIPFTGRFPGVSIHDRIKPIEDGRSFALRQWENNLEVGNFPEMIVGPGANRESLKSRIPGGYLETDVVGDLVPSPVQDLGSNTQAYLGEMGRLRSERGGSAMDMQDPQSQLLRGQNNVGAVAANRSLNGAEMRSAWYARNLAESLYRQLFLLVHQVLRRYEVDPIGVWVADQFVQVDTRQFQEREDVKIRSGLSAGERMRQVQSLDMNINYQLQVAQIAGPGVLSNIDSLYTALMDRDKASGIDDPQRYWLDPKGPQSLEAQEANAQNAQQQQEMAARLQHAEGQLKEQELQLKKYEHDGNLKFDYDKLKAETGQDEAKTVADNITKLKVAEIAHDSGAESEEAGEGTDQGGNRESG